MFYSIFYGVCVCATVCVCVCVCVCVFDYGYYCASGLKKTQGLLQGKVWLSRFAKKGKAWSSIKLFTTPIFQLLQGLGLTDRVNWRKQIVEIFGGLVSGETEYPKMCVNVKPAKCATTVVKMLLLIKSETQWWKCTTRLDVWWRHKIKHVLV